MSTNGASRGATPPLLEGILQTPSAPSSASARAYLRTGLPGVYQDGRFGMGFVGALELVLDPIVSTLDSLHAHLDTDIAPSGFLELIGAWLGLTIGEEVETASQRAMVRSAMELTRRRGTADGLQLLLDLRFPELRLEVQDGGSCTAATGATNGSGDGTGASGDPPAGRFRITSPVRLSEEDRAAIRRVVDYERPVHVGYELVEPDPDPVSGPRAAEVPR